VGSRSGVGQGMIGGDAPRRRRDDGAEEAARDGGVPAGEAASGCYGRRRRRGSGERVRPTGTGSCFKGGPVGSQRRGFGGARPTRGGSGGEQGGRGVGQHDGVASGGSGPAATRVGGVLPRDSGGRRGWRDAG
jgi:hypothetical protein